MNKLDKQYQDLLQDILDNGVTKKDRTGTGTISVFGRQIRHKMSDGFPLLTTKKMPFKTIVTELLWFLRGDTNIKYLVDNNCHIWDGDAYKRYFNKTKDLTKDNFEAKGNGVIVIKGFDSKSINQYGTFSGTISNSYFRPYTQEEFINKIKTDDEFAKTWGNLGPIYGKQWRKWSYPTGIGSTGSFNAQTGESKSNGYSTTFNLIDQIQNSINLLKTDPDSRRNRVSAWNVGEIDQMVLPPCHTDFQFFTRELSEGEREDLYWKKYGYDSVNMEGNDLTGIPTRAVSLMWNQRSVDTFPGLPFNIASYGLLLEIIAKEVNMVPDELIGNLGDVHLYNNHIEQAELLLTREPFELPKLTIEHSSLSPVELVHKLENYQSHPAIKAPLSN